jgi:hypothetical protein
MLALCWRSALLLASAAVVMSGCRGWKSQPTAWSNATGAEQFERLWWADVKAKRWKEVGYRIAATYVEVTPNGVRDREQALTHLQQLDLQEFSLGDVNVRPNGNDLVITYTISMRGTLAGKPLLLERMPMMTVWQRQKSGWIAIVRTNLQSSAL